MLPAAKDHQESAALVLHIDPLSPPAPNEVPPWLDDLEMKPGGPPVHSMGIRRLSADQWLDVDHHRTAELAYKSHLLNADRDAVFAAMPGIEEESQELLDQIVANLAEHHGLVVTPDASLHPLDAAGRLIQEDLTILRETAEGTILIGGTVCFPSGWFLQEKLGLPVAAIHEPIPRYATELAAKVDRYFERLTVERPGWRRNWFVYDDPNLFQPADPTNEVPADGVRRFYLRSERETMRRLPRTNVIVFTIRTQQVQLDALAHRPDVAADIAAFFRGSPDVSARLKGVAPFRDELMEQLDRLAGASP